MTRIELITKIPHLEWTENSTWEFSVVSRYDLEEKSSSIFQISEDDEIYAVLGFIYPNLCLPPVMWLFLTKDCERHARKGVKTLKDAIRYLPAGTTTIVGNRFEEGKRFAEFFGFKLLGIGPTVDGRAYDVYRRD